MIHQYVPFQTDFSLPISYHIWAKLHVQLGHKTRRNDFFTAFPAEDDRFCLKFAHSFMGKPAWMK